MFVVVYRATQSPVGWGGAMPKNSVCAFVSRQHAERFLDELTYGEAKNYEIVEYEPVARCAPG